MRVRALVSLVVLLMGCPSPITVGTVSFFRGNPVDVSPGESVELTWEAQNAGGCLLTPGDVVLPAKGALVVTPEVTTDYVITCNSGTGRLTIKVSAVPTPVLDAPTNVMVTPQDGTLRVAWTQTAGSAAVFFAEAAGIELSNIDSKPGRAVFRSVVSPFTISGLVNGRTYYLRVLAISGSLESALSTEVSGAPVGPTTGTDPYFSEQWHLVSSNGEDLRVTDPWNAGVRGEGVKVAVVDDGIDEAHEDLKQNILTLASHDYLGNSPVRFAEHGTCVAGLIAARDQNGVGLRGVAPRAGVMSFNLLQDLTSSNEHDAMVRQKDVVGISNNSWGDAYDNTGMLTFADPQWLSGVTEGATTGRGGKGVVYFWASGNGGDPSEGGLDDSNYDAQANSRFVLAIGGVGRDGKKADYAEGGANVLVVAPTEGNDFVALVTTDITGSAGYNDGSDSSEHVNASYSRTMTGTSGSTPVAAGVGALVLQVRPELSYRDVRRVLALSARRNDPTSPGWTNNGAGLPVNHAYGFGVVDANAAVLLARTIVPVGPELTFNALVMHPNTSVPDNDTTGVSSSVTIAASRIGHVEVIELELTITHGRTSDLEISLQKSGGALDLLYPFHSCIDPETWNPTPCSDIDGWVFTSVRHLDEPADGQWTLTVKDRRAGIVGSLTSWQLRIYGSQ